MKTTVNKLICILATVALVTSAIGAVGDLRIQQSTGSSWPDRVFATANNALIGTSGSGVPQATIVGTGLTLAGGTLSNAGVTMLAGTTDQVVVSAATGSVTLSLPQAIATTSSPTFVGITLSGIITFDANTQIYRLGAGKVGLDHIGGADPQFYLRESGSTKFGLESTGNVGYISTLYAAGSIQLRTANGVTALTLSSTQNATFAGAVTTAAPTTGTAAPWKTGVAVTTSGLTLSTTVYVQVDISGTLYKVATVN